MYALLIRNSVSMYAHLNVRKKQKLLRKDAEKRNS